MSNQRKWRCRFWESLRIWMKDRLLARRRIRFTLEDYSSGKLIIACFLSVQVSEHFDLTKTWARRLFIAHGPTSDPSPRRHLHPCRIYARRHSSPPTATPIHAHLAWSIPPWSRSLSPTTSCQTTPEAERWITRTISEWHGDGVPETFIRPHLEYGWNMLEAHQQPHGDCSRSQC
jgi:hypothetical protein